MRSTVIAFVTLFTFAAAGAQTFIRPLPGKKMIKLLTRKNFPNMDAVIVLDEQSYIVQSATRFVYGFGFEVPTTSESNVLIVKVFDNAAVKEYADQDFYFDAYAATGNKSVFYARARVLKPDGSVQVMPKSDVHEVAFLKGPDGTPLIYHVIVKIPGVAPGDIIQYESFHQTDVYGMPLKHTFGGLFFYNNNDLTLYSNLYVTVPSTYSVHFYNFPEKVVGKPTVVRRTSSSGNQEVTYFYSTTDLRAIPDEPYSFPFDAASIMTALSGSSSKDSTTWNELATEFEKSLQAGPGVGENELKKLGVVDKDAGSVKSLSTIDSLYTKIRKYFVVSDLGSLYPDKSEIANDFDLKKADASDLAFILYRILESWGVDVHPVWIRDARDGNFEESVPILDWFDRFGVLAIVNGKKMLYDFDRSVPTHYEMPWFLQNDPVMVLVKDSCYEWNVADCGPVQPNLSFENHVMTVSGNGKVHDSMILDFKGRPAEDLRDEFYESDSETVANHFRDELENNLFSKINSVQLNDFSDEAQFAASVSGISNVNTQRVDSLLIVTPNDMILNDFRNKLYSSTRHDNFDFGVPLTFRVQFELAVPPGYVYVDSLKNETLAGPANASAVSQVRTFGNRIEDATMVQLPEPYLSVVLFPKLMSFLDKVESLSSRSIVMRKVKQAGKDVTVSPLSSEKSHIH